jgi:hypothetical protein
LIQAGGHTGGIIFRGDKILKNVEQDELNFYTELFSNTTTIEDMIEFREFVPHFFGAEITEEKSYVVLENLLWGCENANIIDCKIGKETWNKFTEPSKVAKFRKKALATTSASLGFRISGIVVKDARNHIIESFRNEEGYFKVTESNISEYFKKLVGENLRQVKSAIKLTKKLIAWFRKQRSKKFVTSSVFYVFTKSGETKMKLIDFEHAIDAEGERDDSKLYLDVIQGLKSVVNTWKSLLQEKDN